MDINEFDRLLEEAKISKKEFSLLVDMNYNSIINWNKNKIPSWVKSWLENYIKAKKFDELVEIIQPYFIENLKYKLVK